MNCYKYRVKYYSDVDADAPDGTATEVGVPMAENYCGAMSNIIEYFREDVIDDVYLKCITDSGLLPISEEVIDKAAEDWIW